MSSVTEQPLAHPAKASTNLPRRFSLFSPEVRVAIASFLGIAGSVTMFTHISPVFLKPISDEFGWGLSTYPLILGTAALASTVATPFIGKGLDRFGVKPFLLIGAFGYSASVLAVALSQSAALLWIAQFMMVVLGLGSGVIAYSKLITLVFAEGRGKAQGILLGSAAALGATALIPLANQLVQHFGWRGGLAAVASIQLALALVAFVIAPTNADKEPSDAASETEKEPRRPKFGLLFKEIRTKFEFWALFAATFLLTAANTAIRIHAFPILAERSFSENEAAIALGAVPMASIAAAFLGGYCLDRWQNPKISVLFFACSAFGIALIGFAPSTPVVIAGMVLIGFSIGPELAVAAYIISRQFGTRSFAETDAWITAGIKVSLGVGPFLMGLAYDALGNYNLAIIAAFCISVSATIMMALQPKYRFTLHGDEN